MEPIENNLFSQASSEESANVSGGSGGYGYYYQTPRISYNLDNYFLALGAFYTNPPDVISTQTTLVGTVVTTFTSFVNGITPDEALAASQIGLGVGIGGYWH